MSTVEVVLSGRFSQGGYHGDCGGCGCYGNLVGFVYQHSVAVEWVLTPPVALVVMVTPSVPTMDIKVLCTCTVKVYRIKTNSLSCEQLYI